MSDIAKPFVSVAFLREHEKSCRGRALGINPCADTNDVVKNSILAVADGFRDCAAEIERLEGKILMAEDALKEIASRCYNRLASINEIK